MSDPIHERRRRACEAGWADDVDFEREVIVAVEIATRVRITDEAIRAYWDSIALSSSAPAAIAAALRELGFEVEE